MDLTERQTRAMRIDRQLASAGWTAEAFDFEVEYEVAAAGDPEHGFVDYLLTDSGGSPLAVVEAKRSSRDPLAGKEQARRYAAAIEQATGSGPFVFLANGNETWFWDRGANPRRVAGFFLREELERRRFQRDNRIQLSEIPLDGTIAERPYQHEAIRRTQSAFSEGRRAALWVMATGTGKTRTAVALIDSLMKARWAQKVLFLVDRRALSEQAYDAIQRHLPAEPAMELTSSTYDHTRRLYVATLQTMQDFHEEFSPGAFDLVISDEAHRSIYNRWRVVLEYFDALLLGLTATPSDFIDRNTFDFFGCRDDEPTFAYDFDRAVQDGYIVDFEAYHARTVFQINGIHGVDLPPEQQRDLIESGLAPEDIDFAGTQLERRVTNVDTTRRLVTEFYENCLREPEGVLPGKSIIFAMGHAHARRLWEMFNTEYPQHPGLAEIIDSQIEGPSALLRQFKAESMPRIAISVDMLDTGVDIPSVVNLGFLKPVFSRIKFWQMIGRGSRTIDSDNEKPWCPVGSKTRFRILDFWENFERFRLDPEGIEPSHATPVTTRYFRALVRLTRVARRTGNDELAQETVSTLRRLTTQLPMESAGIREHRSLIEEVTSDSFWYDLNENRLNILALNVAPLMQYLGGVDIKAFAFLAKCAEYLATVLVPDLPAAQGIAESIREDLTRLPIEHPDVARHRDTVAAAHSPNWASAIDLEDIRQIAFDLASLMHLRLREPSFVVTLDLEDAFVDQRWIQVGPGAAEFDVSEYVSRVEFRLRELADAHPAFIRLAADEPLSDQDIAAVEETLDVPELFITEDTLRAAYRAPHGSLVALIRHALGIEALPAREDAIRDALETFVSSKGYLDADQILFVRLFASRLMQGGRVSRSDLFEAPFTSLGLDADQALPEDDLDDLFALARSYEVP